MRDSAQISVIFASGLGSLVCPVLCTDLYSVDDGFGLGRAGGGAPVLGCRSAAAAAAEMEAVQSGLGLGRRSEHVR